MKANVKKSATMVFNEKFCKNNEEEKVYLWGDKCSFQNDEEKNDEQQCCKE